MKPFGNGPCGPALPPGVHVFHANHRVLGPGAYTTSMSRTSRRIHGPSTPKEKGEDLGLGVRLLFADDQIAILEKPAGLLSARMGDQVGDSIFDVVKAWAKIDGPASRNLTGGAKRGKDRDSRPAWIIHRLDREVSGVMVFALTNDAYMQLKDDLQVRRITRRYAAVVEGEIPKGAHGTVTGFLTDQGAARPVKVLSDAQGTSHAVDDLEIEDDALAEAGPAAKRAITHWQCVASGRGRSLLEVRLDTGRKHQIRAHLASVGHVICGDKLYGSKDTYFTRVALHAADLRLSHPRTGFEKSFHAPLPREFFIGVGVEIGAWPAMGAAAPGAPAATAAASAASLPTTLVKKEDPAMVAKNAEAAAKSSQKGEWVDSPAGKVFKAFKVDAQGKVVKPPPKTASAPTKSAERTDVKALIASVDSPAMGEDAGWDHVAPWYDDLLTRRKSDHHESVVLPGVVRLLAPKKGERALDVACGEGSLCRQLAEAGIEAVGVDASPKLIAAAQAIKPQVLKAETSFVVGDARKLPGSEGIEGPFDMASCVLALMNMDPLDQVLAGVSYLLKPNGRFVAVMLHPAFRCPGQTHWGEQGAPVGARNFRKPGQQTAVLASEARSKEWDKAKKAGTTPEAAGEFKIFRKVEGYLSPVHKAVVMNPGEVASGAKAVSTVTWHRPLQAYVAAFAKAGLLIDALEEWASVRQSEAGPRSREEDRIRREIPMFLAIRGVKK